MPKNVLIGGAWPYANYKLHIGHIAALLPGDVIARYYRLNDYNVVFVSGTDCHGTPTTITAKKEGILASEVAERFHNFDKEDMKKLGVSYDLYAATIDQKHKDEAMRMYKLIYDNGYLYEKDEEQDYCPSCNLFLADRDIIGVCPECGKETRGDQCDNCLAIIESIDLKDKKCSTCHSQTLLKQNKHLYFALSKFQKELEDYVAKYSHNWRKNAQNETIKFLKMGLIDRAATRQLDWGIDVPVDGFEDKKIYVWIEAVMGYLTTCKRVLENKNENYEDFITNPDTISYYIHGKDNIVFHSIIYPALIMAMRNNYNLPTYIVSSEYLNMKDQKMSKSVGNIKTISEMMDIYEVDTIRYYLLANGPEKKDTNFSEEDLINTHNKFLVGVLGNFINRNLSFMKKKFDGKITIGTVDEEIIEETKKTYEEVGDLIEKGELKRALEMAISYVVLGNKYYDDKTPWIKVSENINEFNNITYTCCYMIANIANIFEPFIPSTCSKIRNILHLESIEWKEVEIKEDIILDEVPLLFMRIDDKKEK